MQKKQVDLNDIDHFSLPEGIKVKCCYSRFSLHSLTKETQRKVFEWSFKNLKPQGTLLIETRSKKDSKFGQGTKVDEDAYIGTHYRRFQSMGQLVSELEEVGFTIHSANEHTVKGETKIEDAEVLRISAYCNKV